MFCPKCGGSVADDAEFCSKCGKSLGVSVGGGAAAAPARIQQKAERKGVKTSYVVVLLLVLVGFFGYVALQLRHEASLRSVQVVQQPQQPPLRQHRTTFGGGALTVAQGHRSYYKMEVPADAINVKLQGHFAATGGSGNDIIVSVMNEEGFINSQNGHGNNALWETEGKVTVGDIDLTLPDGAGTYYLIFSNTFSLLSPKAIQENIALTYLSRQQ